MKTKEEIEQLAKQLCNIPIDLVIDEEERYYKNFQKYDGIIQGYTQCQEDIGDKKYTEDDIREAIDMARMLSHVSCLDDVEYRLKYSNTEEEIINSLNKQD